MTETRSVKDLAVGDIVATAMNPHMSGAPELSEGLHTVTVVYPAQEGCWIGFDDHEWTVALAYSDTVEVVPATPSPQPPGR